MTEIIRNFIGNDIWATFIMSFFPMIELKGAIVFARGLDFNFFYAFLFSYIGSTLVFFPIYFLLKPVLRLIKKIKWISALAYKIENYFNEKAEQALLKQKQMNKNMSAETLKKIGVFCFIGIPLPLTGIWAGTAIAVFLNLKFKDAILPVALGNFVAGLLISLLAELCIRLWTIEVLDYILYALFFLALILTVVIIIKLVRSKSSSQEKGE